MWAADPGDERFPNRTKAATRSTPPTWPELVRCDSESPLARRP